MITAKGYHYYNDYHRPEITLRFENVGQLMAHIKEKALSKKAISFPAHNDDWTFDQRFAGAMGACLRWQDEVRYDGNAVMCIELITDENERIQFSSGSRTDKQGHISSIMKEAMQNLKTWAEAEYVFAD